MIERDWIPNAALLDVARRIFGEDQVVEAWTERRFRIATTETSIDIGEAAVRLRFASGRTVDFWSSEWGGIELVP